MDADAPALRQFAEVPAAIAADAPASPLGPQAAGEGRPLVATLDPAGLSPERYRGLLERFRAGLGDALPASPYRIEVLDRTAPDLDAEGRNAFPKAGGYADMLAGPAAEGAFFVPVYKLSGTGCAITGMPPGYDIRRRLSRPVRGASVDTGPLDAEAFHWFVLMHEVGHCLLGFSEARADTFAALMALHEGRMSAAQLAVLARYREADEWTTPDLDDDHFVSAPLWEVVRRSGSLRASRAFLGMSVDGVASLAREVADLHAPNPAAMADAQAIRGSLLAAAARGPGDAPDGFAAWVRSHADVPVLRRLDRVLGRLARGGGPLPPFRPDRPGFRAAMAALAEGGDATASAILASLDARGASAADAPPPTTYFEENIPFARGPSGFDMMSLSEDAIPGADDAR